VEQHAIGIGPGGVFLRSILFGPALDQATQVVVKPRAANLESSSCSDGHVKRLAPFPGTRPPIRLGVPAGNPPDAVDSICGDVASRPGTTHVRPNRRISGLLKRVLKGRPVFRGNGLTVIDGATSEKT
jgi:hypothetical protein